MQASGPDLLSELGTAHSALAKSLATLSKFRGKAGELLLVPEQGKVGEGVDLHLEALVCSTLTSKPSPDYSVYVL
jgi:hypothetical protein